MDFTDWRGESICSSECWQSFPWGFFSFILYLRSGCRPLETCLSHSEKDRVVGLILSPYASFYTESLLFRSKRCLQHDPCFTRQNSEKEPKFHEFKTRKVWFIFKKSFQMNNYNHCLCSFSLINSPSYCCLSITHYVGLKCTLFYFLACQQTLHIVFSRVSLQ